MLKKGQQRAYFNEVWDSMLAHLLAFCEAHDPEELHQFRVQVKKIKALLQFLQDSPDTKQRAPLQAIFKQAGKIRSAHIHLAFIEQYRVANAEFKNEQEKIARSESKRFCSKTGVYVKTLKRLRKSLAANFQDVENKVIVHRCKKRLKKITRFFERSDLPAEKLHINRNKIKNLLYCCNALPATLVEQLQLNITYLDQLQDAIGNWHDIVFMEGLLKQEGFTGSKIVEKLDRRRGRMYAAIRTLTDDFRGKAVLL